VGGYELLETLLSEKCTVRQVVHEMLDIYTFNPIWKTFGTGNSHRSH
jgi:hypothetical protein